jgi:prevent-host-death family protein
MNSTTTQITLSELPEALQQLIANVQRTGKPLTVVDNGKPVVIVSPVSSQQKRPAFGVLKESGEILGDIIEPVVSPTIWKVL